MPRASPPLLTTSTGRATSRHLSRPPQRPPPRNTAHQPSATPTNRHPTLSSAAIIAANGSSTRQSATHRGAQPTGRAHVRPQMPVTARAAHNHLAPRGRAHRCAPLFGAARRTTPQHINIPIWPLSHTAPYHCPPSAHRCSPLLTAGHRCSPLLTASHCFRDIAINSYFPFKK